MLFLKAANEKILSEKTDVSQRAQRWIKHEEFLAQSWIKVPKLSYNLRSLPPDCETASCSTAVKAHLEMRKQSVCANTVQWDLRSRSSWSGSTLCITAQFLKASWRQILHSTKREFTVEICSPFYPGLLTGLPNFTFHIKFSQLATLHGAHPEMLYIY